jgi:hypothetical protein
MDAEYPSVEPLNVPGLDVFFQPCAHCRHMGVVVTRRIADRLELFCTGCRSASVAAERRAHRVDRRRRPPIHAFDGEPRQAERRRAPAYPREIV